MNIETIQDAYYMFTAVSSSIVLILGFLLQRLQLPSGNEIQNFKKVRLYLSISYFILGASGLFSILSSPQFTTSLLLTLLTVSVASFQSLLFTVVHILLMQPNYVSRYDIKKHMLMLAGASIVMFTVYSLDVIPGIVLAVIVLLLYLMQQAYYIIQFNNLYRVKQKFMGLYYNKVQDSRLKTLVVSFYASFSVGIMSLAASVLGLWVYVAFIVVYTLYYTHVVVLLYNKFSPSYLSPVVQTKNNTEAAYTPVTPDTSVTDADGEMDEATFTLNLKRWVAAKGFAQCDLSVDEVASLLGTNRNYLRKYFRDNIHSDFRTWRSELRIEEAKKLLITHPEYSTSQIGEMVGFNHRSNFFTQFAKITGVSPRDWRRQQGINTD